MICSRSGFVGEWNSKNKKVDTNVARIDVVAGDTLDFVTDCRESVTSDSFEWTVGLRLSDETGNAADQWDSSADFHGPAINSIPRQIAQAWRLAYCRPITREEMELSCQFVERQMNALRQSGTQVNREAISMSSLCQQILSSNEFLYLD
jgi:hypothetical protein